MTRPPLQEHINRHWPGCTCPWEWGSYGVLYGVHCGYGWLRKSTDPACPHHGDRRPPPKDPTIPREGK